MSTLKTPRRRFRRGFALLLLVLGFSSLMVASPSMARADNPFPVYQGNGIEGADPVSTGCSRDAYTVDSARIIGHDVSAATGQTMLLDFGVLNLRYSPRCQSNWATAYLSAPMGGHGYRIAVASSTWPAVVRIEGGNNQTHYTFHWMPSSSQYSGTLYSDMVYSPTMAHSSGTEAPNCARASFAIVLYSQYNHEDLANFEQRGWGSGYNGDAVTSCI